MTALRAVHVRPVDSVVAALGAHGPVKRAGAGWQAKCPAHDDRSPSLSIAEGDDGRALLTCHAGCELRAIVEAIGLRLTDLFPPRNEPAERVTTVYEYHDAEGRRTMDVVRTEPGKDGKKKDFFQRGADGKALSSVPRTPYRWPDLQRSPDAPVFVVEGERDVDNLRAIGLVATTNPGGTGSSKLWETGPFQAAMRGRTVFVIPDNDEPGRKHAATVRAAIEKVCTRVEILELPGLPDKGDVSDWLAAGGTPQKLLELTTAAERAARQYSLAEMVPRAMASLEEERGHGIETGVRALDQLTGGGPRARELYVIAAASGVGKTAIAMQVALMGAMSCKQIPALVISVEQDEIDLCVRYLVHQAGVDSSRVRSGTLTRDDWVTLHRAAIELRGCAEITLRSLMTYEEIEREIIAFRKRFPTGPLTVVVDYINGVMAGGGRNPIREQIIHVSRGLKMLANKHNLILVCPAQLNQSAEKEARDPVITDVAESVAVRRFADVVILVSNQDRGVMGDRRYRLAVGKNRLGQDGVAVEAVFRGKTYSLEDFA